MNKTSSVYRQRPMRIAHFSDTHLLSLRGVNPLAFANKRITGGINLLFNRGGQYPVQVARRLVQDINQQRPDHVIVTGDLSNLSLEPEFELIAELLGDIDLPPSEITVIPGNHDCYTMSAAWRDDFGRVLSPFIEGDLPAARNERRYPFVRLRGEVAILALDSSRPAPPFIAWGTVGRTQLRLLRGLLEHPQVVDRYRIIAVHHPPRSRHVEWHSRLTDAAEMLEVIEQAGAELLLHGHLHRHVREQLDGPDGPVTSFGVTSGTWLSPRDAARRASYNVYEIVGHRLVGVATRWYDAASEAFVAGPVGIGSC